MFYNITGTTRQNENIALIVMPTTNGFYQHVTDDANSKSAHLEVQYMSNESITDLIDWWKKDFKKYRVDEITECDALKKVKNMTYLIANHDVVLQSPLLLDEKED